MNRASRIAALCGLLFALSAAFAHAFGTIGEVRLAELPSEGQRTVALIRTSGPFPYRKDGAAFGNRERRLPQADYGYYREYTVPTPGAPDRGPRRIVAGGNGELYYTADHYRTFRRILE
jgi:ribonuclease T1